MERRLVPRQSRTNACHPVQSERFERSQEENPVEKHLQTRGASPLEEEDFPRCGSDLPRIAFRGVFLILRRDGLIPRNLGARPSSVASALCVLAIAASFCLSKPAEAVLERYGNVQILEETV